MLSVRSSNFKKQFESLPPNIQRLAARLYEIFGEDPNDPRIRQHDLHDSSKGRHRDGSKSVEFTARYRAIYVIDNGPDGMGERLAFWYWIGAHTSDNSFVGTKQDKR